MPLAKETLPTCPSNAAIKPLAAGSFGNLLLRELPTLVNSDRLQFLSIPSVVELLSNGFNYVFPLHYEGPQDSSCAKNLLSAIQNPEAVDAKLDKEIAAHRIAGPYSYPPFPIFIYLHLVWFLKRQRVNSI